MMAINILLAWMMALTCIAQANNYEGDFAGNTDDDFWKVSLHRKNFDLECTNCFYTLSNATNNGELTRHVHLDLTNMVESLIRTAESVQGSNPSPADGNRGREFRAARSADDLNFDPDQVGDKPLATAKLSMEADSCSVSVKVRENYGHITIEGTLDSNIDHLFMLLPKLHGKMKSGDLADYIQALSMGTDDGSKQHERQSQVRDEAYSGEERESTLTVRNQMIKCKNCRVVTASFTNYGHLTIIPKVNLHNNSDADDLQEESSDHTSNPPAGDSLDTAGQTTRGLRSLDGIDDNVRDESNSSGIDRTIECTDCMVTYISWVNNGNITFDLKGLDDDSLTIARETANKIKSLFISENNGKDGPKEMEYQKILGKDQPLDRYLENDFDSSLKKDIHCTSCAVVVIYFANSGNEPSVLTKSSLNR